MIVFVLLLPVALGSYEPVISVPGPVISASETCPEGHRWVMGQCFCYDGGDNCAELIKKYTCEPWTRERYLRERLPMNVRQACGYSCGICDAWKATTDSAPSPSPTPVGTTKGEATTGAGPSTRSGPGNGSAEVNVGIGSETPEKQCKDIAPAWACKGLKKAYACNAPKFVKYPAQKCAKTCGMCQ
ncbi:hypothetical protein AAVH_20103 [Aphelenchoides avenae]|nr:hypothetical protein AAVH_20103 [Aphelenchus avenae]